jgi:hypothetical protein
MEHLHGGVPLPPGTGERTLMLPSWAVDMLNRRRNRRSGELTCQPGIP